MPSAAEARERLRIPVADLFERVCLGEGSTTGILSPQERRDAFQAFLQTSVPGARPGRDWKFDYAHLAAELPYAAEGMSEGPYAPLLPASALRAQVLLSFPLAEIRGPLAPLPREDGVHLAYTLVSKPSLEASREAFRQGLGSAVAWRDDPFASLAVAFAHTGIVVRVSKGARPERPILIHHGASSRGSNFPYIRVVLEAGAEAVVIEDTTSSGFTSGIVEVVLGDRARLDYVALQRSASDATMLMSRGAVCGAGATCRWFLAELGSALSRSVIATRLEGRGATSELSALFFNSGDQHVDLTTDVEHASPDTTSRTNVKSAAGGHGQGRYLGNIAIAAHANGSDAALRDDALLLSKHAHIDSVPALEIACNDVKAFHGATVGSIAEDELFYAESRGIERGAAERMIALGFFEPIVAAFPVDPIREYLRTALANKAGGGSP